MNDTPQQIPGQQPTTPPEPVTPPTQPQPIEPAPPQEPKASQFSTVSILIVIIAVSAYIAVASQSNLWPFSSDVAEVTTFTPRPTQELSIPEGWKKFTNENLNYMLAYPTNILNQVDEVLEGGTANNPSFRYVDGEGHISLGVYDYDQNLSAEQWFKRELNAIAAPYDFQKTTINNIEATRALRLGASCYIEWALFPKESKIFTLRIEQCDTSKSQVSRNLFSDLISTFKFIEVSTVNWKIHKNDEIGFEFKHPESMRIVSNIFAPDSDAGFEFEFIVDVKVNGLGLDGLILCNNPGSGVKGIYQPQLFSVSTGDGTLIRGETGLILPMGSDEPGRERLWRGGLGVSPGGDLCSFKFSSPDDVSGAGELVEQIISTFKFN